VEFGVQFGGDSNLSKWSCNGGGQGKLNTHERLVSKGKHNVRIEETTFKTTKIVRE
jgi:hypothetical protein